MPSFTTSCCGHWTFLRLDPLDLPLLSLLLGPNPYVPDLDWPGTCMSEPASSSDIQGLTQAVRQLSIAISGHPAEPATPSSPGGWSLVGEESVDFRFREDIECVASSQRVAEDGPGPIPEVLLRFAESRLTAKHPGAAFRAQRAFEAGFWARIAVATNTDYQLREPIPGFKIGHWIVLRCSEFGGRAWFTNRVDFGRAIEKDTASCVFESFASQTELEIFCAGASVPVPVLRTWRNQRSNASRRGTQASLSGPLHPSQ